MNGSRSGSLPRYSRTDEYGTQQTERYDAPRRTMASGSKPPLPLPTPRCSLSSSAPSSRQAGPHYSLIYLHTCRERESRQDRASGYNPAKDQSSTLTYHICNPATCQPSLHPALTHSHAPFPLLSLVCVGDGWSLLARPVRLPPTLHAALQVGGKTFHILST